MDFNKQTTGVKVVFRSILKSEKERVILLCEVVMNSWWCYIISISCAHKLMHRTITFEQQHIIRVLFQIDIVIIRPTPAELCMDLAIQTVVTSDDFYIESFCHY